MVAVVVSWVVAVVVWFLMVAVVVSWVVAVAVVVVGVVCSRRGARVRTHVVVVVVA